MDDDTTTEDLRLDVTPLTPPPATPASPTQPAGRRKRLWRAALAGCVVVIGLAVVFSGYFPLRTEARSSAGPGYQGLSPMLS